jgi:hypothetical protein
VIYVSVKVSIKAYSGNCTVFEYKGESPDMWLRSMQRVLKNPKFQADYKHANRGYAFVSIPDLEGLFLPSGVRAVKDRVRYPEFYVEIEEALLAISSGLWNDVPYFREFKSSIRKIWNYAQEDGILELERKVYQALLEDDNGGLSVEAVLERLFKSGSVAGFKQVRDALGHLCRLYVVERLQDMFSVRYGILEET